jgi:alkylresorcinol/alkylpyrone synthase
VRRVPIFGLGCAGGVTGLAVATSLARSRPGTNVLIVALEACTLSFRTDRLEKADIIATVLFGDGAGAAVLSCRPGKGELQDITLGEGHEHLWADTLDIMGWQVDDTGLGVIFDRSIPDFAGDFFSRAAAEALEKAGIERDELDRYVCHPGGRKVVEALESALRLAPGSLDAERETLKEYGNMSAPTVLFVLKKVIENGEKGRMLMTALGPGFTASFLPITVGVETPDGVAKTTGRAGRQYA